MHNSFVDVYQLGLSNQHCDLPLVLFDWTSTGGKQGAIVELKLLTLRNAQQMADDFITGQQGSDEKPLDCWLRSKEGPCINNVGKVMLSLLGVSNFY